jgi:TIR domain-containing protein/reverse transcriptase-like protein
MSDIFLSYSRSDRLIARSLAGALERRGWSVFWDPQILPGHDFPEKIRSEAETAGCVVVLWSKRSARSKWVLREADIGASRKRLLPVLIGAVSPPDRFSTLNAVDLKGWTPDTPHPGLKDLLDAIVGMLGGEPRKRAAFEAALRNVERFGDTDVLPFPIEKTVFAESRRESLELLQRIDAKFESFVASFRPYYETSSYPVSLWGFRWVTQIDPVWNAYLLGLVTAIGSHIEAVRPPLDQGAVFSFRFKPDGETGALFDREVGWEQYQERSLVLAKDSIAQATDPKEPRVVVCDIADFYARISHQHVKQALQTPGVDPEIADRILVLLRVLSGGEPYGLPIGGPAARLLSELVLRSVDDLLSIEGIPYCRFADDFHLFASGENDAYQKLMFLSDKLFGRLGLTLQKSKTRIMSAQEFRATSQFAQALGAQPEEEGAGKRFALLKLKIPFNPYSEDPAGDYEALRREIDKHDLLGMLTRELGKSRPDPALTRRLIGAARYLEPKNRKIAVQALLETSTLERLYPLLSSLLQTFKYLVEPQAGDEGGNDTFDLEAKTPPGHDPGLDEETRRKVFDQLVELIRSRSYLMGIPAHLAYAVRVLVHDTRPATTNVLAAAYKAATGLVRRDIILAMARRRGVAWLLNLMGERNLTPWERRALLIASVRLGDAGRRWREEQAGSLSPMDRLALEWAERKQSRQGADEPR